MPADGQEPPARLPGSSVRAPLPLEARDPGLGLACLSSQRCRWFTESLPQPHTHDVWGQASVACGPCRANPSQGGPSRRQAPLSTLERAGLACLPGQRHMGPPGRRPPKGNQKLLQNRKKHRPGLNPGGSCWGSGATWAPPSLHPPRRPREPLWCLHTAEVCALLQKDPSDPSGLKAARAPAGSPRPEPQCSPP